MDWSAEKPVTAWLHACREMIALEATSLMHAAGAAEGRPVTPAGGQWLWRLRRGLRLSTVDGGAATDSPTTWVAAPSGSASASVRECRSLGTACWWWCAPGGDDPSPRRRGINKVPRLTRRSSPPAPFPATLLSCNGFDRCVARTSATWTCSAVLDLARLLERALRDSAYLADRLRSRRALDRLLCALLRRAHAFRRLDHHDGSHARLVLMMSVTPMY